MSSPRPAVSGIAPDVRAALAAFLVSQGMADGSADGFVEALSRDLRAGVPAAGRIYDGLVRRGIEASRDAILGLSVEVADLSALASPTRET